MLDSDSHIKVAYFGHPGSFTWMAAQEFIKKHRISKFWLLPCESLEEVIDYVLIGESYGVLPYYNSTGGVVDTPEDILKLYQELQIDEFSLPVHHCLLSKSGSGLEDIKRIVSHPQALIQCQDYLRTHLPSAQQSIYSTTSTAARNLSLDLLPDDCAVVASKEAADIYQLKVLDSNIEDRVDNSTRFKVLYQTKHH